MVDLGSAQPRASSWRRSVGFFFNKTRPLLAGTVTSKNFYNKYLAATHHHTQSPPVYTQFSAYVLHTQPVCYFLEKMYRHPSGTGKTRQNSIAMAFLTRSKGTAGPKTAQCEALSQKGIKENGLDCRAETVLGVAPTHCVRMKLHCTRVQRQPAANSNSPQIYGGLRQPEGTCTLATNCYHRS